MSTVARLRHASRLASSVVTMDDVMRLEPADFLASRVFSGRAASAGTAGPPEGDQVPR